MTRYSKIILRQGKESAIRRFHPWLFSGAIKRTEGSVSEGDIVELFSSSNEYLATGHYQGGSIAVKIFSFQQTEVSYNFWKSKIMAAFEVRKFLGLAGNNLTNAYRLVNSEGDGLSGLIIDYYNGDAVMQANSLGMYNIVGGIVEILKELFGDQLKSVYDKSEKATPTFFPPPPSGGGVRGGGRGSNYLYGEPHQTQILEMGHHFLVDREKGQKTGFFLDQRGNRMFAQFYAGNRKVLNAFCYSGAFSVYALKGGAAIVHSVDSSRQAIEWTEENITLNGIEKIHHKSIVADIRKYLAETDETYDMIILDPPAFAKTHTVSHNALQAYRSINAQAMKKLNRNGLLFTFSCSQAISRELFQSAIMAAALEAEREVKILHHLSQGPDHPVSIYHPEGEYLKGLILFII